MRVAVIETPDLGDRSYVVSDGRCALVIDPQRDLDRVEAVLAELGVPVTLVLETHLHNGYVTGGLALARRTGATYVVAGRDEVAFERRSVSDGDELSAGGLTVRVSGRLDHTVALASTASSSRPTSDGCSPGGDRLGEVPDGPVWVRCATGGRSHSG
jgi:glyoxylase-like metal-dependent hydrolase (beta-lactamase superfamily II)